RDAVELDALGLHESVFQRLHARIVGEGHRQFERHAPPPAAYPPKTARRSSFQKQSTSVNPAAFNAARCWSSVAGKGSRAAVPVRGSPCRTSAPSASADAPARWARAVTTPSYRRRSPVVGALVRSAFRKTPPGFRCARISR